MATPVKATHQRIRRIRRPPAYGVIQGPHPIPIVGHRQRNAPRPSKWAARLNRRRTVFRDATRFLHGWFPPILRCKPCGSCSMTKVFVPPRIAA